MSFLSVIKSIGRTIENIAGVGLKVADTVETAAQPFVAILNPAAGAILSTVRNVTVGLETMITTAQAGQAKQQTAVQILEAEIPQLQEVIAATGSGFKLNQDEAKALVDASVALFNTLAAIQARFKAPAAASPPTA